MGNNESVQSSQDYASCLLPNEASFINALRQRETYDIQSKVDKSVDSIGAVPELTGQSSVVSDQGTELTCASHAVGKAIVEIIDGFRFDSDQEKIIEDLIKTVQPSLQPTFILEFANKSIEIEIWNPGYRSRSRIVTISIFVQSQTNVDQHNWIGPKMTSQELKDKNTRVVAVWKRKNTTQSVHSYHAVYVKNITKSPGKTEFTLDCVNSWGDQQDPNPKISNRDISSLHYISLYMDTTLLVTSAGPSAEYRGGKIGVYKEAGIHNNCPYYKQLDTERTDGEEEVIYRSKMGLLISPQDTHP